MLQIFIILMIFLKTVLVLFIVWHSYLKKPIDVLFFLIWALVYKPVSYFLLIRSFSLQSQDTGIKTITMLDEQGGESCMCGAEWCEGLDKMKYSSYWLLFDK